MNTPNYNFQQMRANITLLIKRKRRELKMSQAQFAERAYISEDTVRRLEKPEGDIRLTTLIGIARAFKIDIKDLF